LVTLAQERVPAMHAIAAIFFNHRQRRLRAFWRIGLFVIIWLSLTIALLVAAKLAVVGTLDGSAGEYAFEAVCGFLGALTALWLVGRLFDRRRLVDFGLRLDRHWWPDFLIGLVLGGLAITAAMLVCLSFGWAKITGSLVVSETFLGRGFVLNFIGFALLVLLAAALEELLCRGYLLTNMAEGFHFPRAGPG
jgi:membrane protease YdiL (CAAX protease family)